MESRLFLILLAKSRKTLEQSDPEMRLSLGQLADLYVRNRAVFGSCIPKVYENLFKQLNEYRTVSVHPKQFKVDKKTADAVFNLTLAFLLDEACAPPRKKGRAASSTK